MLDNIAQTGLRGEAFKHDKITGRQGGGCSRHWAIVNLKKTLGDSWKICQDGGARVNKA